MAGEVVAVEGGTVPGLRAIGPTTQGTSTDGTATCHVAVVAEVVSVGVGEGAALRCRDPHRPALAQAPVTGASPRAASALTGVGTHGSARAHPGATLARGMAATAMVGRRVAHVPSLRTGVRLFPSGGDTRRRGAHRRGGAGGTLVSHPDRQGVTQGPEAAAGGGQRHPDGASVVIACRRTTQMTSGGMGELQAVRRTETGGETAHRLSRHNLDLLDGSTVVLCKTNGAGPYPRRNGTGKSMGVVVGISCVGYSERQWAGGIAVTAARRQWLV